MEATPDAALLKFMLQHLDMLDRQIEDLERQRDEVLLSAGVMPAPAEGERPMKPKTPVAIRQLREAHQILWRIEEDMRRLPADKAIRLFEELARAERDNPPQDEPIEVWLERAALAVRKEMDE
jgi:hypothetical protein